MSWTCFCACRWNGRLVLSISVNLWHVYVHVGVFGRRLVYVSASYYKTVIMANRDTWIRICIGWLIAWTIVLHIYILPFNQNANASINTQRYINIGQKHSHEYVHAHIRMEHHTHIHIYRDTCMQTCRQSGQQETLRLVGTHAGPAHSETDTYIHLHIFVVGLAG